MGQDENRKPFESLAMPHLDAAYNLARWLTRNDDAVDHHLEAVFAKLEGPGRDRRSHHGSARNMRAS